VKPELAAKLEGHYPTVSRVHAEIFRDGNNLFIRDYGSTNGTFINDQRIEAYTFNPVQIGDSVRLGSKLCVLFLASEGENE
jgi:pSer/pThr/pTyr-binding forkhead associated (FHA) protein